MPALLPRQDCCEMVSFHGIRTRSQCTRAATVLRAGKPYCTIHDPERIAAKQAEKSAAFGVEMARCRRVAEKLTARERITMAAIKAVNEEFGWQPVIDAVRAWQALP